MKKHIPNLLTSLNLFSGCVAIVMAFQGEYRLVLMWVVIAAIFDFFDGLAARVLKANSPIGKDLDSLADMVSFGVAPAMVVFHFLGEKGGLIVYDTTLLQYLPYIAFLLVVFSGLRLAKFNVDTRQTESFIGLATPANGLFWVSFISALMNHERVVITSGLIYTIVIGIILFSLLMVAEVKMFSLKVKNLKFRGNEQRYFLIVFIVAMLIFFQELGIAAGILLYIALSLIENRKAIHSPKKPYNT